MSRFKQSMSHFLFVFILACRLLLYEVLKVDLNEKPHSQVVFVGKSMAEARWKRHSTGNTISLSKCKKKVDRITHTHTHPQVTRIPISMGCGLSPGSLEAPSNTYFIRNSPSNKKRELYKNAARRIMKMNDRWKTLTAEMLHATDQNFAQTCCHKLTK